MRQNQNENVQYFEQQGLFSMKCGLHAVNNLLGKHQYDKSHFDAICKELQALTNESFQYPLLGGDYDVSVLIKALQQKNFEISWHDARKQFKKDMFTKQQLLKMQGFLVNVKLPSKFYHKILNISGRHWISIKLFSSNNVQKTIKLDSNETEPLQMSEDSLYQFLQNQRKKGSQILKVTKK